MQMKFSRKFALVGALALAATGLVRAQTTTQGGIAGTVFDATDSAVPNATVVIHNDGTNAELKLTSGEGGEFRAPQLAPGTYTVTITASGFAETKTTQVIVQVNSLTEVNPHLTNGSSSDTVQVTAEVPVISYDSPAFGGHLSNTEIENIPINNRRWSSLALVTPGVTNNQSGFGLLSFRATSTLLNNVEIDGADDNQAFFSEERGRTRAGYSTSQVAVREFQVNTGVYSAEFGRAVGGVVNSVTKSGTNAIHGEAYFYNRDDGRAAFQPLATNTTLVNGAYVTSPYKPKDKRNQYGFGVGGPIIKDKLFWFYAFDRFARNFPGTARANTPGTFFVNAAALPAGAACSATSFTYVDSNGRTQTAPAGTIRLSNGQPSASTASNGGCSLSLRLALGSYTAGLNAYNTQLAALLPDLGSVPRRGDQLINTPKLDYQINGKNHVSFLYHRLRWDSPGGVQTQSTNNYAIDSFGTDFVKLDYGVAKLDSIFGRFTNELRYQYGRELNNEGMQPISDYTRTNLLNNTGFAPGIALFTSQGFNLGTQYYSFRTAYPDERKWQIGDTAAIQFGRHSIKFGEDIVHNYDYQDNIFQNNGQYTYNSIANYFSDLLSKGRTQTCDSAGTGVGTLPCYQSFAQGIGASKVQIATVDYGFFVQDDWKLTPRLTVNLGVRYDYQSVPKPFAVNSSFPQSSFKPSDKNNVSPRIGFALDPFGTGKTVLRGGYGIYYGRLINSGILNTYVNSGASNGQNQYSFTPTTLNAPVFPQIAAGLPPASSIGPNVQYTSTNLQNPYTQQFDLTVQQDLGRQNVLSISYLGSLGRELPNFLNLNFDPSQTYTNNYRAIAGTDGTCGPLVCGTVIPVKTYAVRRQTGASASVNQAVGPQPLFNAVTAVVSNINSSYNAVSVDVTNRAFKYVTFDANYTWAHALDFNQNESTAASTNGWFDPYGNTRANYGNSNLSVRHRVVGWAILNAPGLNGNGVVKALTNGWSLKPLVQIQSGLPYSVNVSGNAPNQCNANGCLQASFSGLAGTGVSYIPALGRNTQFYPRTLLVDMRVQKDFAVNVKDQKIALQLIGEAFNLANHRNVTGINTTGYTLGSTQAATAAATSPTLTYQPAFGTVTSANSNYAYGPRNIQLALRVLF